MTNSLDEVGAKPIKFLAFSSNNYARTGSMNPYTNSVCCALYKYPRNRGIS